MCLYNVESSKISGSNSHSDKQKMASYTCGTFPDPPKMNE